VPTYANYTPPITNDGVTYASSKVMPALEGDLWNGAQTSTDPVSVVYHEAAVASVNFTATGGPSTNSTYVVMQTCLADGTWFDVAWCLWTGTQGSASFLLSGGVAGANAFQQSRASGTAPSSNGSNQCTLGGQIRFVGKSTLGASSSSSSSSGPPLQVTVTICLKLLGLR